MGLNMILVSHSLEIKYFIFLELKELISDSLFKSHDLKEKQFITVN